MTQRSRGRRQGEVFSMRIEPAVRAELERLCADDDGPKHLGPWLVWRACRYCPIDAALPRRRGSTAPGAAIPELGDRPGNTDAGELAPGSASPRPGTAERVVLDLCAGSGSWSEPYRLAGYAVRRVTLPADDVRTFIPPRDVWGVLAAPPCEEFSLAKNGQARDFVRGLETVAACLRIIMTLQPSPRWWAIENPVGLLSRWLGRPAFVFQPYEFGDPWSKRTALWGQFRAPERGPFVRAIGGGGPICERCSPDAPGPCSVAAHRAITPPGFARAFQEANP